MAIYQSIRFVTNFSPMLKYVDNVRKGELYTKAIYTANLYLCNYHKKHRKWKRLFFARTDRAFGLTELHERSLLGSLMLKFCDSVPLKRDVKLGRGERDRTVAVQTKWRYVILKRPSCRIIRETRNIAWHDASELRVFLSARFTRHDESQIHRVPIICIETIYLFSVFSADVAFRCSSAPGSRPTGNHVTIKEPNRRSLFTKGIKLRDRGTILHGSKQRRR